MIFVYGTVCIDRIRRIPHLPTPGGYVEILEEQHLLGGEAANTANALQVWGKAPILGGNGIGHGPVATDLRRLLAEHNLSAELLAGSVSENAVPAICDVYITPDGERTMFGLGFASANHSQPLESLPWDDVSWFTVDPNMGTPARDAARAAVSKGKNIYMMDFTQQTDVIPAKSFWQCSTDWIGHRNNIQKNVRWLNDFAAGNGAFCILSDGPNGFVAGGAGYPVRTYPPFPAPAMVDTTGAGDTFRAGMLYGLSEGRSIPDSLRLAAVAGCLKVQYLGATLQVPSIKEIETHLAQHPEIARLYE